MDAAMIARVMSVIPERTAWAHSGSAFVLQESHGAQVRYLAQFLNWLSPLSAITKDDQRALGLGHLNAGRLVSTPILIEP